jgi:PBSX family phage terminase large subunit
MPLINGKFTEGVYPSKKHVRVLFDNSKKWRYRVLRGGRNGYKDWSIATAAVERGIRVSTHFLFTREVQLTIKDSAHKLLKNTIKRLGYQKYFDITKTEITCKINDTTMIFRGLNDLVSDDVKSTEGIDICVIGEAQNLSEKSFIDIDGTIRKKNSEVWIAYNTKMDTDFVYQFTVTNPPDNLICDLVNYTDAPDWMIEDVVKDQAERMKRENYQLYLNNWMGQPLTLGLFFAELGKHNAETPFVIPDLDDNERLIASLDHGIAHNTCFHLMYLDSDGYIHGLFSYYQNGSTTKAHAEAIIEMIEGFRFSWHKYPSEIHYDYAMETKHKLSETHYRSDLDEYIDAFKTRLGGKSVKFVPANKRKADGCNIMRQVFSIGNGVPTYRYFDGLNDGMIHSVKNVITDKVNPEVYAKLDGDDGADTLRYGIMAAVVKMAQLNRPKEKSRVRGNRDLAAFNNKYKNSDSGVY